MNEPLVTRITCFCSGLPGPLTVPVHPITPGPFAAASAVGAEQELLC